jgi:hypothetical protein
VHAKEITFVQAVLPAPQDAQNTVINGECSEIATVEESPVDSKG